MLKICTLSNLMVLNSFLMLFWPKNVFDPLGEILTTQNVETPHDSDNWSLGISRRTYGFALVRSVVRPFVRSFVRDAISGDPRIRFWWFFAQSYILVSLKKVPSEFFKKSRLPPRGFWPKKPSFWLKMAFWAYIFKTAHQILMIFSQMLDIIALNDLALVVCTKKF